MDLLCTENIMTDNESDTTCKQQSEQELQQLQQQQTVIGIATSPCSNSSSSLWSSHSSSSSSSSSSGYYSRNSSASRASISSSGSTNSRCPLNSGDRRTWSHSSLENYESDIVVVNENGCVYLPTQEPQHKEAEQDQQQQQQLHQTQQQQEVETQQQRIIAYNKHFNRALDCVSTATDDPTFRTDRCLENALKVEEKRPQSVCSYFKTVQKDITAQMRKIVVEWMMEVCAEEKCQEEVVLLAINYLDRFLSTKSVRKANLQIIAAACLLLASKLREPSCRALSADLLVFYTDNSICKSDLIKWELFVLSRLGWDLSSVTPLDFLELLLIRLPIRSTKCHDLNIDKVRQHAQAFISLAAKEHYFLTYSASTIAASSIAAAMSGLHWHLRTGKTLLYLLNILTDLTSVEQEYLHECMMKMEAIFEEHSRSLQPYLMSMDGQQPQQQLHQQVQLPQAQQQQHHHLHLHHVMLPDLTQTCKMQANAQKDVQDIKF